MADRLLSDAARTQVVKLDGEPLTMWENFERFAGYVRKPSVTDSALSGPVS